MPLYLVTDRHCDVKVMVEADRPGSAINALIADRFVASSALDAIAALDLQADGVRVLRSNRTFEGSEPEQREDSKETLDAPDLSEVCNCVGDDDEPTCPVHGSLRAEADESYGALR